MPLYAVLGKFTDKRMENIKDIKTGLAASKKLARAGMVTQCEEW